MSLGSLSKPTPLDPHGYWPSTLQWLPLVPGDSQGFKGSDYVSFPHGIKPWILLWPSIWVETTLSPSLLIKMCSFAKVQGLLRRSYEFGTDQNLLEHRGAILNLKSTDLVYEGEVIKLTKNEFQILRVLFEHAGSIVAR